ncbi:hypothetical protein ARSEF4850_006344 [Beauveria asiatica]
MEQTVTIVNNSGKIISTGKQLFSIFKEAKAAYSEKKDGVRAERALQRANTFDGTASVARSVPRAPSVQQAPSVQYDEVQYPPRTLSRAQTAYYVEDAERAPTVYYAQEDQYTLHDQQRRSSYDAASVASSRRSHRTRTSHHGTHRPRSARAPSEYSVALTEGNLKTHSQAASTRPSRPPTTMSRYRSPYAETVPMGQSNLDLTIVERSVYQPAQPRQPSIVQRTRSESQLGALVPQHEAPGSQYGALVPQSGALVPQPKKKKIDMNLAYGNIPPDLAERTDLADTDSGEATALVRKVESLLDEANCVHHSAQAMIKHLQEKPDAAAAVALTLSELSTAAAKMSPAVLGLLKGGSPAVFALLASPQFLIASGLAVGVTVVMFGGWKIVKRVQQERAMQQAALAYQPLPAIEEPEPMERPILQREQMYAGDYDGYDGYDGYDEALVLDEELSTIESWRRGIEPFGDGESADMELITPEADRATRADPRDRCEDQGDLDDTRSHHSSRTHRTSKTSKTNKTSKTSGTSGTHKSHKSHKSHHSSRRDDEEDRKSSRGSTREGSTTSSKHRSRTDDGRSSRHRSRDDVDLPVRPKAQRQESDLFKSLFRRKNKDASRSQLVVA